MDPSGCLGIGLVDEDHYKIDNHKLNCCLYREQMKEKRELEQEPDNLPPAFDLKPEPIQVEEGETAKFMAKVSGHPRPRLTWWVNGSMIIAVSTTFYIQKKITTFRWIYWSDGHNHCLQTATVCQLLMTHSGYIYEKNLNY